MIKNSVSCLVVYKDQLLLVLENQSGEVLWDIPAGGIEVDETPFQAVAREVKEETGIVADSALFSLVSELEKNDGSTHYLFELYVNDADTTLSPEDPDILKAEFKNQEFVAKMIENKKYEHELAKKRLLYFMKNYGK